MEQDNSQGRKDDANKTRYELLPFDALEEVARVLSMGAVKYGDRNWEQGMRFGRIIGAAIRHITAYARGQERDEESGLHHLAHATCCCLFLLAYSLRGVGIDDRAMGVARSGKLITCPVTYWKKQKEGLDVS